ncbi:MAG: helix-hairpin-helix domain-containing protein [Gammaproteobacteria bacterium]|nr:helix-hairpin-helix domain-containing protein [Gammaproteobacteria bacterium]MDE0650812.1 helix-hairpin-helix domain-containing protein [Gammaproteobacteria bacterium]
MSRSQAVALALAVIPLLSAGCAADGDTAEAEPAAAETVEAMGGMDAADAIAALANPNLATEDELTAVLGITAEAAAAVAGGRPYLRAADLHTVLAGAIGEEAALGAYRALWLPINLNDVTNDEILLIPGVGDRMAHEFEEYRPYVDMGEFRMEIGKYVDENEVERLARYVYVPIDLNSASRDEIMAVPGMSERMAHEFEEYRPYADLDQFRREIGKYVDENEVARFERYVTLNQDG